MIRRLLRRLARSRRGQTTSEYMLTIAIIVFGVIIAWYFVVPPMVQGFVRLTQRIAEMNP